MVRIFVVLFSMISFSLVAQAIRVDTYEMTFRKSLFVPKNEFRSVSANGINAGEGFKKVQIRFEITTLSGTSEIFDPNKFYAVSETLKVRIRPIDFTFNDFLMAFKSFGKLSQEPTEGQYGLLYKPEVKDSFTMYGITDYKDLDFPLNYGSLKKPFVRKTYAEPRKWKSNLLDIYIIVPSELNTFDLYYGPKKLMPVLWEEKS